MQDQAPVRQQAQEAGDPAQVRLHARLQHHPVPLVRDLQTHRHPRQHLLLDRQVLPPQGRSATGTQQGPTKEGGARAGPGVHLGQPLRSPVPQPQGAMQADPHQVRLPDGPLPPGMLLPALGCHVQEGCLHSEGQREEPGSENQRS